VDHPLPRHWQGQPQGLCKPRARQSARQEWQERGVGAGSWCPYRPSAGPFPWSRSSWVGNVAVGNGWVAETNW